MLDVKNEYSLCLSDINLWLDHRKNKPLGFISHAHADHVAKHETIFCSPETGNFLKKRYKYGKSQIKAKEYCSPFSYKNYLLELLPAGHITGSAMLHATNLDNGKTLLFTGDFKCRSSHTAKNAIFKHADHLVMETTFGLPEYIMPSTDDALTMLIQFIENSLTDGYTPVLLAYALGKAQEAHYYLGQYNIAPILHPSVAKMSMECIRMRVPLPNFYYLDELAPEKQCIIMPPGALKTNYLSSVGKTKTAMLTGWAMGGKNKWRYRHVDQLIPLSDHADFTDLVQTVKRVQPKQITTIHGSTKEFAAHLRTLGYNARSAADSDQLETH